MHYCALIAVSLLMSLTAANAFVTSQYGNDFYFGAMKNHYGQVSRLWLSVFTNSTGSNVVSFTVKVMDFIVSNNVTDHSMPVTVDLPLYAIVQDYSYDQRFKGIHVYTHDKSQYISVTLYNWNDGSVGDYMPFPCNVRSTESVLLQESIREYEYYVMSSKTHPNEYYWSEVLLIACQDETIITITPSQQLLIPISLQEPNSLSVVLQRGQSYSFILNAGQTLLLGSYIEDITGTEIKSTNHLTVVSGHECGNVPYNMKWCEHLTTQIPPAHTWGYEFILVPFKGRTNGQYFKAIAKGEATQLSLYCNNSDNITTMDISHTAYYQTFFVDSNTYCLLSSSKPILLVQLALGSEYNGVGDPIMIRQTPLQQFSTSPIVFEALDEEHFTSTYVSIITTDNPDNITYDGKPLCNDSDDCFIAVYNSNNEVKGYSYAMEVESGLHTIAGAGSISGMVYGFTHDNTRRTHGHSLTTELNIILENMFVSFVSPEYTILEDEGSICILLYCKAPAGTTISVKVKTIPPVSDDFIPVDGTVRCHEQGTNTQININIVNDNLIEEVEEFQVVFESDKVFDSIHNTTTIRVQDNDNALIGFTSEELLSNDLLKLGVGLISANTWDEPRLQEGLAIHLTIAIAISDEDVVCRSYHDASLSYSVQELIVFFNLTRVSMSCSHTLSVGDNISISINRQARMNNNINTIFMDEQQIELLQPTERLYSSFISSHSVTSTNTVFIPSSSYECTHEPSLLISDNTVLLLCVSSSCVTLIVIVLTTAMIVLVRRRSIKQKPIIQGAVNPIAQLDHPSKDLPDK